MSAARAAAVFDFPNDNQRLIVEVGFSSARVRQSVGVLRMGHRIVCLKNECPYKENGQTEEISDLSVSAPADDELLKVWKGFRKVVNFINENGKWLTPLLQKCKFG